MDNPFKPAEPTSSTRNRLKTKHASRKSRGRIFLLQSLIAIFLFIGLLLVPSTIEWLSYCIARGRVRATHETLDAFSPTSFANTSRLVAESITFSVVNINTHNSDNLNHMHSAGQGSGVIVGSDGYILTNYHVIEDAQDYFITLHDATQCRATLIGIDPTTDIAVLKIDKAHLHAATWGDSDTLAAGDPG